MLILADASNLPVKNRPIVLAMGCFDGIHLGHQKVISTAVEQAKAQAGEAWVYTFNPHPAKILVPRKTPPLISAEPSRLRRFDALGVNGVIEIPFTHEYAQLTPNEFLTDLIEQIPTLSGVVCGQDWSFGYRASGKFQTLETFGTAHGFTATAVAPVLLNGERISSTHIRNAVLAGNLPEAERMLGRPLSLFGKVIPGNKIGRELGYPTANIDPLNELLPSPGVYAAWTGIQKTENGEQKPEKKSDVPHPSAVFIGKRETFGCHKHVIESHLFDFTGDLYGQTLEISLVKKLRAVTPFSSEKALIEQIKADIVQIRELLTPQ